MAEQDRWTEDRGRGRYAQEDRFRRGPDDYDRRAEAGYGRGYRESYGDYDRSFERDRGAAQAYGAGYGIDEAGFGEAASGDPRYGGRWGGGPGQDPGEPYYSGRYSHSDDSAHHEGYGDPNHGHDPDRTWMERAGERVASWFGGGEVQRNHRGRGPKTYTRSDERIREDLNDRLTDDAWLDASEIEVQVANCEVTLSGSVASREDRRRAEDLAEQVSGVRHLQNNIRVQPAGGEDRPLPVPMV
jgi:osmotically-inducible protein OsmY